MSHQASPSSARLNQRFGEYTFSRTSSSRLLPFSIAELANRRTAVYMVALCLTSAEACRRRHRSVFSRQMTPDPRRRQF